MASSLKKLPLAESAMLRLVALFLQCNEINETTKARILAKALESKALYRQADDGSRDSH